METFIRKRTISVLLLVACCLSFAFRTDHQRSVKIRETASENLISEAQKHLDVREATGDNDGPMIRKYLKITGLNEGYPWCAAFQAYIHQQVDIPTPRSARVVDWFVYNVIWKKQFGAIPETFQKAGMVGALYYQHLGRLGHIFLIVGEDNNNYFTIEGNTNGSGSREGDGVYRKIRSKKSVAALADYCINGRDFVELYDDYLNKVMK